MKFQLILSTFILLVSGALSSMAQNPAKQATPASPAVSVTTFVAGAQDDPRLSPEQQEQMSKAGQENPSRPAQVLTDKKLSGKEMPDENNYGEKNAKPDPDSDSRIRQEIATREKNEGKPAAPSTPAAVSQPVNEQPQSIPAKNVVNYRLLNGPNEQPQPAGSVRATDYRKLNGPNEQPGQVPGK